MPASSRRASARSATLNRRVQVEREGAEASARCLDISDGGMRLDLAEPLNLNDELTIRLAVDLALPARVVWTNGHECGVAFEQGIDSARLVEKTADDKRRELSRRPLPSQDIPARIVADGYVHPTTISSVTQQGALVTHKGRFHPGLHVTLLTDNGDEKLGIVQWTHEHFASVFLVDHFSLEELDKLQPLRRPAR